MGKLREIKEALHTRRKLLDDLQAAFDDLDKAYLILYCQQQKQSAGPA